MNRRDFLKFLGSLPLIGLAAKTKMPIVQTPAKEAPLPIVRNNELQFTQLYKTSSQVQKFTIDPNDDWDIITGDLDGNIVVRKLSELKNCKFDIVAVSRCSDE